MRVRIQHCLEGGRGKGSTFKLACPLRGLRAKGTNELCSFVSMNNHNLTMENITLEGTLGSVHCTFAKRCLYFGPFDTSDKLNRRV